MVQFYLMVIVFAVDYAGNWHGWIHAAGISTNKFEVLCPATVKGNVPGAMFVVIQRGLSENGELVSVHVIPSTVWSLHTTNIMCLKLLIVSKTPRCNLGYSFPVYSQEKSK